MKKEIFNQIDENLYNIRVKETEKFLEELSVIESAIDNFSPHSLSSTENQPATNNINEAEELKKQLVQIEFKRKKIIEDMETDEITLRENIGEINISIIESQNKDNNSKKNTITMLN